MSRDGINYVFNGQHTIEIVAAVSGSRETPVWCMIYDDLSYEHEADIFANQQKYVKSLIPYEVFTANIEAGNNTQLMIRDLIESYGLTISCHLDFNLRTITAWHLLHLTLITPFWFLLPATICPQFEQCHLNGVHSS